MLIESHVKNHVRLIDYLYLLPQSFEATALSVVSRWGGGRGKMCPCPLKLASYSPEVRLPQSTQHFCHFKFLSFLPRPTSSKTMATVVSCCLADIVCGIPCHKSSHLRMSWEWRKEDFKQPLWLADSLYNHEPHLRSTFSPAVSETKQLFTLHSNKSFRLLETVDKTDKPPLTQVVYIHWCLFYECSSWPSTLVN